jgi:hypothetical protein
MPGKLVIYRRQAGGKTPFSLRVLQRSNPSPPFAKAGAALTITIDTRTAAIAKTTITRLKAPLATVSCCCPIIFLLLRLGRVIYLSNRSY